ncbi:MAG: hypothetical protein E7Z90_00150 [Cyanobacteria bacterium SIG29]|nr:hypothetical protein [Cyanobacteria bacterium SIG29]
MSSINSIGGINYKDWQGLPSQTTVSNPTEIHTKSISGTETDSFESSKKPDNCKDGKDDGKIGFWGALGNAIKGVGKTIVNGVKGMFTNKEGKFSLGKTLLSIGTVALCIAVPAVGVAACVVGGTMGAIQVGKGIHKAATAETDAQAEQAWQEIGGGTFTVAASIVGAKGGMKAMKTSAAKSGASALQNVDDAIAAGQKVTFRQRAKAFGSDAVSSAKYNINQAKTTFKPYAEAGKIKYAEAKAAKIQKNSAALTPDELHAVNNAKYQRMFAGDDTLAVLDKMDDISGVANKYYTQGKAAGINAIKHPIQTAKSAWASAKGVVTKENAGKLWAGIKESVSKARHTSVKDIGSKLSGTAKNIYAELINGESTYAQAVQKYGYDNVAQVLQYVGGTIFSMENI